jgi:hypothetical protein
MAQQMGQITSSRTTGLYNRRNHEVARLGVLPRGLHSMPGI